MNACQRVNIDKTIENGLNTHLLMTRAQDHPKPIKIVAVACGPRSATEFEPSSLALDSRSILSSHLDRLRLSRDECLA